MLRFAEEIMLLLLGDEDGQFAHVPQASVDCALAGAVLMDLALENRIDTDLDQLVLVDATPVGDDLLDPTLARIAQTTETQDARHWIEDTTGHADEIRDRALARLVESGILRREEDRFLWVLRTRRYPVVDDRAEREVKLRIMEVLFSDEIPDARDVVIICLADVCGIFRELLSSKELKSASKRIEQVRKLDLIGQAVSRAVRDIESSLAASIAQPFY